MTEADVRVYMRKLFVALSHIHDYRIIHRDIKPSKFLFHIASQEEPASLRSRYAGVLVDFGLAQLEDGCAGTRGASAISKSNANARSATNTTNVPPPKGSEKRPSSQIERFQELMQKQPAGYVINDPRMAIRAPRAGTRGFRAPEVLFKQAQQTIAIDIWSAGVILLTLLTRRYPFFQSNDDQDAIVEVACIFGHQEMARAAVRYDRDWRCNVPSVPEQAVPFEEVVRRLNPAGLAGGQFPSSEAFDFLRKCLTLDVSERITAHQALAHPFLSI